MAWVVWLIGLAACGSGGGTATTAPEAPTTTGVATTTTASPTTTAAPPEVSGEFSISNTTEGGGPVLVDTMTVTLEYSSGEEWLAPAATCETDPAAAVTIERELLVAYRCEPAAAPEGARLRGVVEATIFGSDEVFRMETEAR